MVAFISLAELYRAVFNQVITINGFVKGKLWRLLNKAEYRRSTISDAQDVHPEVHIIFVIILQSICICIYLTFVAYLVRNLCRCG